MNRTLDREMTMAIDTLRLAQVQLTKIIRAGELSIHLKDRTISHMAQVCMFFVGQAINVWCREEENTPVQS